MGDDNTKRMKNDLIVDFPCRKQSASASKSKSKSKSESKSESGPKSISRIPAFDFDFDLYSTGASQWLSSFTGMSFILEYTSN